MDFNIFLEKQKETKTELPVFREYGIDFTTGQHIVDTKTNNIKVLEGNDALKVWIWKALRTERFKHFLYSDSYGSELRTNIGTIYNKTIKDALMINQIRDCLLVNPYILDCYGFKIDSNDMTHPKISFSVTTIYGTVEIGGVTI